MYNNQSKEEFSNFLLSDLFADKKKKKVTGGMSMESGGGMSGGGGGMSMESGGDVAEKVSSETSSGTLADSGKMDALMASLAFAEKTGMTNQIAGTRKDGTDTNGGGMVKGMGAGAMAGASFGGVGAAIGAGVGALGGVLSARAARKQKARDAQALADRNIADIQLSAGQNEQNALQNIIAGFKSAMIR